MCVFVYMCVCVFLLSSSKCVSLPSLPGTEQTSRVFRNVVHLFTKLRCPPMSFYNTQTHTIQKKKKTVLLPLIKSIPIILLTRHNWPIRA